MLQLLMIKELIAVEIQRVNSIEVGFKSVEALSRNYASDVMIGRLTRNYFGNCYRNLEQRENSE